MNKRVGIVGLGRVGMVAAEKYINEGYQVFGYARRPEVIAEFQRLGGTHVENPATVASSAETVIVLVLNDSQVIDVVTGDRRDTGRDVFRFDRHLHEYHKSEQPRNGLPSSVNKRG